MGRGKREEQNREIGDPGRVELMRVFWVASPRFPVVKKLGSLRAWTCGKVLARSAYKLTLTPPLSRHFDLADQVRRAATAIPANIAERYALATTLQFLRCLRIALGSATELLTHLDLVRDLELAPSAAVEEVRRVCDEEISRLVGLIRSLQSG
jgi:four helix bundle protein